MTRSWQRHYDKGVPTSISYPDWTLSDLLEKTAEKHPEYTAICFNDLKISYRDLLKRVNALASGLMALGVKKGDCIALLLPNSPTYIVSYYAVVKLGAMVANLNVTYHGEELQSALNHSQAVLVITLDLFLKNITEVVLTTPVRQLVIHSVFGVEKDINGLDRLPPLHKVNDLIERHRDNAFQNRGTPDDIAVLQYTSGVTGKPKAAMLTHRALIANLLQIAAWNTVKTTENRAVICIIPFFHVFGMTVCMHVSVFSAYKMVLFPQFDWSSIISILDAVREHKPISLPAVPALWAALVSSSEVSRVDLSSVEIASGGGAPLPKWIQEKYYNLTGNYVAQAYGLSEVASTALISPFRNGRISESVGLPLPDTDIRIMDLETGNKECQTGEVGELAIQGPQLMKGYWRDEQGTRECVRNGWLYTGDLGYRDEQGFFYLVDRKDDLIITKGYNVYPSQVEEVLIRHPSIKEAVVVGVADPKRGQSLTAFLIADADDKPERRELSIFCSQYLSDYQVPRTFTFLAELPKTKIGKPVRRLLRESIQHPD